MSIICQGITLSGKPCHRKIKNQLYCYQHRRALQSSGIIQYRQTKPLECIICCESLANQRRALACGHWIHNICILESAKAECPICRSKLNLGKRATNHIDKLAKKREAEYIEEEEEELRVELQQQVAGLITPALRERIHEVVGDLLDETINIDASDVLNDIFDDDTYQSFLHNLMGYDLLESDFFDNSDGAEIDLDELDYDSA